MVFKSSVVGYERYRKLGGQMGNRAYDSLIQGPRAELKKSDIKYCISQRLTLEEMDLYSAVLEPLPSL